MGGFCDRNTSPNRHVMVGDTDNSSQVLTHVCFHGGETVTCVEWVSTDPVVCEDVARAIDDGR